MTNAIPNIETVTNQAIAQLEFTARDAEQYLRNAIREDNQRLMGMAISSYQRLGNKLVSLIGQENLLDISREDEGLFQRYLLQHHIGNTASLTLATGNRVEMTQPDNILINEIKNGEYLDVYSATNTLAIGNKTNLILEALDHVKTEFPRPRLQIVYDQPETPIEIGDVVEPTNPTEPDEDIGTKAGPGGNGGDNGDNGGNGTRNTPYVEKASGLEGAKRYFDERSIPYVEKVSFSTF